MPRLFIFEVSGWVYLSALLLLLVFSSQPLCLEPKLKPACLHVAVGTATWELFNETAFYLESACLSKLKLFCSNASLSVNF